MSRRERQRRRRRNQGGPARVLFLMFGVLAATLAIAGLSVVGYVVSIANSAPSLDTLKPADPGENSVIYADDGTRLGVIPSVILRTPVGSTQIPQAMKDATVAIEDRRFYQHKGVDFEGVIRAAIKNFKSDKTVQGGSTLTMQLIKNLYTNNRARNGVKGFKRKIREAKLAEDLENRHPGRRGKEWILTKYLNSVPYGTVGGQTAVGVQAASRVFFNKTVGELTLPEAALLAGLPQAPTAYNPYLNPQLATQRRNDVLQQMLKLGYITPDAFDQAESSPLGLKPTTYYQKRRENYFFDYVRQELVKKFGPDKVRRGGLHVYTTIDLKYQQEARAAIAGRLNQGGQPSAALVSIDPKTGDIKAMAASTNYGQSKFNLAAQGHRQPGSTFKMIVLMTALRRNVDINRTSYVSKYLNFFDQKTHTKIDVHTAEGHESNRPKSLFEAVVSSDNTVFQQLDLDLGPKAVRQTAYDMGITSHLDAYPAEALGGLTHGVSPLEMARAYVTINDGGYRLTPIAIKKVVFPDGKVDTSIGRTKRVKVFEDGQTNEAIKAMEANVQRGTGTAAQLGFCPAAGKTGTTNDFTDAWFDGMTTNLNTVVWVGYPGQNTPMTNVPGYGEMFGGDAPAQIWHDFMDKAVNRKGCGQWPKPTQPFHGEPFNGHYAVGGAPSSSCDPTSGYDCSSGNGYGYNNGYGGGYDNGGGNGGTAPSSPGGGGGTGGGGGGGTGGGGGGTGGGGGGTGGGGGGGGGGTGGGGGGGTTGGGGGQAYPPTAYESPPQPAPDTPGTGGAGTGTG